VNPDPGHIGRVGTEYGIIFQGFRGKSVSSIANIAKKTENPGKQAQYSYNYYKTKKTLTSQKIIN
jgi:hypothetical protein